MVPVPAYPWAALQSLISLMQYCISLYFCCHALTLHPHAPWMCFCNTAVPLEEKLPQDLLWGAKPSESKLKQQWCELWGCVSGHPRAREALGPDMLQPHHWTPSQCFCRALLCPGLLSCVPAGGAVPTLRAWLLLWVLFACMAQQGHGWQQGGWLVQQRMLPNSQPANLRAASLESRCWAGPARSVGQPHRLLRIQWAPTNHLSPLQRATQESRLDHQPQHWAPVLAQAKLRLSRCSAICKCSQAQDLGTVHLLGLLGQVLVPLCLP